MVVPVDRVRLYIRKGSYGDAQRRVEELLPMHPSSPELHDVLLELVAARSDLKGWAERLLAQIQDETGTVRATLARLRGEVLPSPVGDTSFFYQRGRDALAKDPPDVNEAIRWFELVPDMDPNSANACMQVDFLNFSLIPPELQRRMKDFRSTFPESMPYYTYSSMRLRSVHNEMIHFQDELLERGLRVPEWLIANLAWTQEVSDQWDLTHAVEKVIASGRYRPALTQLNQIVAVGPFEPAERHRTQLVAVLKAEEELRQLITRADPKTTDLQSVIESYEGLVSILSPDTTQLDEQVVALISIAKRKLEDLIQPRLE